MSAEVMKQALEALEDACGDRCNAEYNPCFQREAITALRKAISELEQRSIEEAEKQEPAAIGDVRALKHRIHELEGEVLGYKRILDEIWTPVSESMPTSGKIVLAFYRNINGKARIIRAHWIAAKTQEADSEQELFEYDEEADAYFTPEGWYENINNWDDYSSVTVHEGQITHWMPLPDAPKEENP
ncbi:MAG: DUF551 domain-containing protein [Burkholderiaceae bacterium]